jgi:hypothetical protein
MSVNIYSVLHKPPDKLVSFSEVGVQAVGSLCPHQILLNMPFWKSQTSVNNQFGGAPSCWKMCCGILRYGPNIVSQHRERDHTPCYKSLPQTLTLDKEIHANSVSLHVILTNVILMPSMCSDLSCVRLWNVMATRTINECCTTSCFIFRVFYFISPRTDHTCFHKSWEHDCIIDRNPIHWTHTFVR